MPAFLYLFLSLACFHLDDVVTPDFDKKGNIVVHGLFKRIISKILLTYGFINITLFVITMLSDCIMVSSKILNFL